MKAQILNIFILDDKMEMVDNLKHYLKNRFGDSLSVLVFTNGKNMLEKVDRSTNLVIMDFDLANEDGQYVFEKVKQINSKTEIIILTSNEDVSKALDSFHNGASNYIIKGKKAFKLVGSDVYVKLTAPIIRIGKEFGISKFMSLFLVTFIIIGVVVVVLILTLPD